ncbi:hypothetical protein L3X38_023787 [Prunus dulcis]|uniref:Uncharacterized protein n=1 Tax=Prunus dulcis TaxID=3755 RepID=A0AAD4Z5J8_PRUDU|nr:hypothetical protein L3X38_023787 [Prunus dulcis]
MCRTLPRVLAPPPSILGLLPPPSLLRMLVSLALGSVFPILSLIISPGGDVSVFMEAATAVLWHLVVFLLMVGFSFMPILYSYFMSILSSVDFMHVRVLFLMGFYCYICLDSFL